jgi:hypothetical protein
LVRFYSAATAQTVSTFLKSIGENGAEGFSFDPADVVSSVAFVGQ